MNNPPNSRLFKDFYPPDPRQPSSAVFPPSHTTPGPNQSSSIPPSSLAPPILDPAHANLSIYEFLLAIETKDSRRQVVQFASAFAEKDYLDLGEIFHMDAKTIEAAVNMREGTARYVRNVMDEYRQK